MLEVKNLRSIYSLLVSFVVVVFFSSIEDQQKIPLAMELSFTI